MDRKWIAATAVAFAVTGFATAALAMPACAPEEIKVLPEFHRFEAVDPTPQPVIAYPFGSRKAYGFDIGFAIDAEGRVTCAGVVDEIRASRRDDASEAETKNAAEITPQRQAALDRIIATRFKPYLADGKPVPAYVKAFIAEEQLPKYHVLPPKGELANAHIHQIWRGHLSSTPSYELDIYGDGRVVYRALNDDLIGTQTYHIAPAEVQALLDTAADIDFWSYDDEAMASPVFQMDGSTLATDVTFGGRSNRLGWASSLFGGEPDRLGELQRAISQAGKTDWWNDLPAEALAQLQANGFDFKGRQGSELLSGAMSLWNGEGAVQRILALGAPVLWSKPAWDGRVSSPLTAALETKRVDMARSMIAAGALLKGDKPVRARVDSAFIAALGGGVMDGVNLILPYGPDMMAPEMSSGKQRISVLFWLVRGGKTPDAGAIAELLIARGAPVNARNSLRQSVLSFAAQGGQIEIIKVLLKHGASPNAIDDDDSPPLAQTWDEDVALFLLEAGADPAKLDGGWDESFYGHVSGDHWTRVRAWLEAHGYGGRLKAYEEKPR